MSLIESSNPAFNDDILDKDYVLSGTSTMTVRGTVNKTLFFVALTTIFGAIGWNMAGSIALGPGIFLVLALVGAGLGFYTYRNPDKAMYTGSAYSGIFGLMVGMVSAFYNAAFPGIVAQALMLTIATTFGMLFLYQAQIIKVTERFRSIMYTAIAGIAIFYLISLVLMLFGVSMDTFHGSGPIGIGLSVVITIVAALSLLLDFDFVEKGAANGLPKYMEWYGAFGLIVTLIWLYMEILRLLSKLRD